MTFLWHLELAVIIQQADLNTTDGSRIASWKRKGCCCIADATHRDISDLVVRRPGLLGCH